MAGERLRALKRRRMAVRSLQSGQEGIFPSNPNTPKPLFAQNKQSPLLPTGGYTRGFAELHNVCRGTRPLLLPISQQLNARSNWQQGSCVELLCSLVGQETAAVWLLLCKQLTLVHQVHNTQGCHRDHEYHYTAVLRSVYYANSIQDEAS